MGGATVTQPVTHTLLGVNHDLDAMRVNETTVRVARVAQSGAAADTIVPVASAKLSPANGGVITPRAREALSPRAYRVNLEGTGTAVLADMNAAVLRLDYSFVFTIVDAAP